MPTITVVMPAYKAVRTIGAAIESVLAQSFDDFELVICDDASPDSTVQAIRQFNDARIILLKNTSNLGAGLSRDRAIAQARGQWLTFLDADDAWLPQRLERMLSVARKHPDAVVFDELMECHDTPDGLQPWRRMRPANMFPGNPDEAREIAVADWIGAQRLITFPLIPVRLIRNYSVVHPAISSGEDIAFRLTLLGRSRAALWYVPEPLYMYRIQAGSLSSRPDSTRLLITALEGALAEFEWCSKTQEAILKRIGMAQRRETYLLFFSALMHRNFSAVVRSSIMHPWVIFEFLQRSARILPYHLSRLRQGGAWKRKF